MGVLAVDPTSPFTGGAILGDRIRMQDHATDPGVFIRSLATRGNLGGLSRATGDCIRVMDAMGQDVVIVETVGVGQDEIDIAQLAHTTWSCVVPGMGDDIQAIKAGILEVADVFAVNKADLDGADRTVRELRPMLELRHAVQAPAMDHDAAPPDGEAKAEGSPQQAPGPARVGAAHPQGGRRAGTRAWTSWWRRSRRTAPSSTPRARRIREERSPRGDAVRGPAARAAAAQGALGEARAREGQAGRGGRAHRRSARRIRTRSPTSSASQLAE